MIKKVGNVSLEERDVILHLFERKNGLTELAKILTPANEQLYENLVTDLGETSSKFQAWWNDMSHKYNWESSEDSNWEINFETCEIYLVTND